MDKRFWAVIGAIVVIFVGILLINNHKQGSSGTSSKQSTPTNHVEGDLTSKVTLVEYGDYECPACESFFTTTQAVQEKYKDTVKFQFRNLPLSQIHPNAFAGARAAEAADLQGKFWQMHDALYTSANWSQWSTSSNPNPYFWQYAKQLGLNVDKFKTDFASETVNDRVNADINAFKKTGRPLSTPTYFLNGKYVDNSSLLGPDGQPSVDAFSKVLDDALAKAK
jgi:protein-disulfide isomerase